MDRQSWCFANELFSKLQAITTSNNSAALLKWNHSYDPDCTAIEFELMFWLLFYFLGKFLWLYYKVDVAIKSCAISSFRLAVPLMDSSIVQLLKFNGIWMRNWRFMYDCHPQSHNSYHLTGGSTPTSQDYNPSLVVYVPELIKTI